MLCFKSSLYPQTSIQAPHKCWMVCCSYGFLEAALWSCFPRKDGEVVPAPLQRIPFPFLIFIPQLLRTSSSSPMSCFLRLKRLFTLFPPPGNSASDSTPVLIILLNLLVVESLTPSLFWAGLGGPPFSVLNLVLCGMLGLPLVAPYWDDMSSSSATGQLEQEPYLFPPRLCGFIPKG